MSDDEPATGADTLVERLIEWGMDTVFGLPGDAINGFIACLAVETPGFSRGDETALPFSNGRRWFVSILVDTSIGHHTPTGAAVGVDAGINDLVTLSTGEKITNPKHERRDRARLAKAARELSRKQKGSANRAKARRKVARVHARITDRRRDHLHKVTTRLVRDNQTIVIEDLNVAGMLGNHTLARAISDAAWSELRAMLEYKAEWYGRELVTVDRWFPSSKTCSSCGYLAQRLPLSVRTWACPGCGAEHDRDVNAARNIRAAGLAVSACGGGVRPTRR